MKRNSTTLFLTSPNSTTALPWVDNAPDFSRFTNPTLAVLQKSWQDFLDSGEELEVIPDPAPPAPEPDWTTFNLAILADADWGAWIGLSPLLLSATTSASLARDLSQLQMGIDAAKATLTAPDATALARWQGYADTYNIAVKF